MKLYSLIFCVSIILMSCKKRAVIDDLSLLNVQKSDHISSEKTVDRSAYFPYALIYEVEQEGEISQLWFFINEETQEILYETNDDMIEAVISYPDGTYKIYGTTESGEHNVIKQQIDIKFYDALESNVLKPIAGKRIISQENIQQNDIECVGFYFDYLQMEGGENVYVTSQIPINSYQLYGFSQLDGDARLTIPLDYRLLFKPNELVSHIESEGFSVKLLNYGPNPYEFVLSPYQH